MSPDDDTERARLARRQAQLVRALVADGPVPEGFKHHQLDNARRVVVAKRRRIAERRKRNAAANDIAQARRARGWRSLWQRLRTRWRADSGM